MNLYRFSLFISIVFVSNVSFGQLDFLNSQVLLFVGSDSIENKRIVAGVYITPLIDKSLKLEIDMSENWKNWQKKITTVRFDSSSLSDKYHISEKNRTIPAYRYFNKEDFEILIAKETYIDLDKTNRPYIDCVLITLPRNFKFVTKSLPLMIGK